MRPIRISGGLLSILRDDVEIKRIHPDTNNNITETKKYG